MFTGGRLSDLISVALKEGHASGSIPMWRVRHEIGRLEGWVQAPNRDGEGTEKRIQPVDRYSAPPRSMSKEHGLEEQPLHTDGAHRRRAPDIVLLHSEKPSSTPTRLLRPTRKDLASTRAGVFLVEAGTDRFLASALDGGLRWDPVCMTPMDARARRVADHFASLQSEAEDFIWHSGDTLLVLDNRRMLHGRAAVSDGETDRVLTRVGLQRND